MGMSMTVSDFVAKGSTGITYSGDGINGWMGNIWARVSGATVRACAHVKFAAVAGVCASPPVAHSVLCDVRMDITAVCSTVGPTEAFGPSAAITNRKPQSDEAIQGARDWASQVL